MISEMKLFGERRASNDTTHRCRLDILLYECGFGSETGWKHLHPDSSDPPPFEYVKEMVDGRIQEICSKVKDFFGSCEKPILYLTGKGNFREAIAKKKPYKGNRLQPKPFHYANIKGYLKVAYDAIEVEGMEADDAMCIDQTEDTIICTRDKDLRQCPGWHFGWELGKQAQFGPELVGHVGYIKLSPDKKKLTGTGYKFFCSQMITGDKVDNISGLPGNGPVEAYKLLSELQVCADMEKAVIEAYKGFYGDSWKEEFMEQAQLLWMVRELDFAGEPIMYKMLNEE